MSEPEIQELTFQLQGLEISVRVSVRPTTGPVSPGASSFVRVEELSEPSSSTHLTTAQENRLLDTAVPGELAAISLPALAHLENRLRGTDTLWTPRARLARACWAGVCARRKLEGDFPTIPQATSPDIPFRNTIYVILSAPDLLQGGWSTSYQTFISACGGVGASRFHPRTVCHAFPARAEVEAFLWGARRQWPPQLED